MRSVLCLHILIALRFSAWNRCRRSHLSSRDEEDLMSLTKRLGQDLELNHTEKGDPL
jgi:hypothetical protein